MPNRETGQKVSRNVNVRNRLLTSSSNNSESSEANERPENKETRLSDVVGDDSSSCVASRTGKQADVT